MSNNIETLVFVASGGYGKRLVEAVPALADETLSKSLGVEFNGFPLVRSQLLQIRDAIEMVKVVVAFTKEKSIEHWQRMVAIGMLPALDYVYTIVGYTPDDSGSDIFKRFADQEGYDPYRYKHTVLTSGDILLRPNLYLEIDRYPNQVCLKEVTTPKIYKNQTNMDVIVGDDDMILGFNEILEPPKMILGHPIFMSPEVAALTLQMELRKSKRDLVLRTLSLGYSFHLMRPDVLINLNTTEDLHIMRELEKGES